MILSKIIWRIIRLYYSCDIPPSVECDGVYFAHSGFGCLFNGRSKIGKGTTIQHSVTIGEVREKFCDWRKLLYRCKSNYYR